MEGHHLASLIQVRLLPSIFVYSAGSTQDSTRVWRALALGCIPVTFFRAVELPFARRLGLDYSQFVINVQPDDYRGVQVWWSGFGQVKCMRTPAYTRPTDGGRLRHVPARVWRVVRYGRTDQEGVRARAATPVLPCGVVCEGLLRAVSPCAWAVYLHVCPSYMCS